MPQRLKLRPGAFLPIGMSVAATMMVLAQYSVHGVVNESDEGTAAHIFQLLMVAQVPIIIWFAIKWMPEDRTQVLRLILVQVSMIFAAVVSVALLTCPFVMLPK